MCFFFSGIIFCVRKKEPAKIFEKVTSERKLELYLKGQCRTIFSQISEGCYGSQHQLRPISMMVQLVCFLQRPCDCIETIY